MEKIKKIWLYSRTFKLNNMEKKGFEKDVALQMVADHMELTDKLEIVKHDDGSFSVMAVFDTSIEQEIQNAIEKAGKLLYCDHITVSDLQETELIIDGVCKMYYKREKHIDEQKRIQERFRLHDMLRMALYDYVDYIEFEPPEPMSYTDKYDIVKVVFEMGLKTK